MKEEDKNKTLLATAGVFILTGIGLLVLVFATVGVAWYKAGVQAEVYRREGVEMSTWEVFVGARPAERTINIK